MNIQKLIAFSYMKNELSERKKTLRNHPIYLQLHQKMKYLVINLTKDLKEHYSKNYKTLK